MILDRDAGMTPARANAAAVLGGCAAGAGRQAWCKEKDVTPERDRSPDNAAEHARHCVPRLAPDR